MTVAEAGHSAKEQEDPDDGRPFVLQAPPQLARPIPQSMIVRLMPVMMLLATGGIIAVMVSSGGGRNPMMFMFPAMMAMSTIAMLVGNMQGGNRKMEMAEKRRDYLRYLDLTRRELIDAAREQRTSLLRTYPHPGQLTVMSASGAFTSPRSEGADGQISVRLGLGTVVLDRPIVSPDSGPVDDLEPVSVAALRRLVRSHSFVHRAPVAVDVPSYPVISVYGEPARARAMLRAALAQLVFGYDEHRVQVAVVAGGKESSAEWDCLKWLPHHCHPEFLDASGPARLREESLERLECLLGSPPGVSDPHVVVICDEAGIGNASWLSPEASPQKVTFVEVCASPTARMRRIAERDGLALHLVNHDDGDRVFSDPPHSGEALFVADVLSRDEAAAIFAHIRRTRSMAIGAHGRSHHGTSRNTAGSSLGDGGHPRPFAELVGAGGGPAIAEILAGRELPAGAGQMPWVRRESAEKLRAAVGRDPSGTPVYLDLKESAQGGHGPHGLCIGATGSGKSEFLRALVLGLVATHSPEQLNLVLVDFKGGATFAGMGGLHHVAASITNLADEQFLVDRMREALEGELVRRQELLRSCGVAKVDDYEAARRANPEFPGPPLPALVLVVDEFSELLTARPEFVDVFVQLGRLGRSLHIHLLLASQRLEEGRLRGLESHLSYRIALKTFSAAESRVVLGNADAYNLPPTPGAGYLKTDVGNAQRFDSFFVSQPNGGGSAHDSRALSFVPAVPQVVPFSAEYTRPAPIPLDAEAVREPAAALPTDSDWDLLTKRLAGAGPKAHAIWLPPLQPRIGLDEFGGMELVDVAGRAKVASSIPWAVLDLPFQQRQSVFDVDLSSPSSCALVVGAPRSGKSYALFGFALSAALRMRPLHLQIYGLDFGGGVLSALDGLPHTAGVARKGENDKQRRILSTVETEIARREEAFRVRGLTSVCTATRGEHGASRDSFAEILVLVDGWSAARSEIVDLDEKIGHIAAQGLAVGIHVIVATSRWMDVRPVVRDALATRVELRIVDPAESMFGRRAAHVIPPECPGRGMTGTGQLIQILAPEISIARGDDPSRANPQDRIDTVREISAAWAVVAPGQRAPRIRLLPEKVPFADLAGILASARAKIDRPDAMSLPLPVGIEENNLAPAYLDLVATPMVLVFGNAGCGKSTLLKVIATATTAVAPASDVRLLLVDYRRKLRNLVPDEYCAGIASTEEELVPMVEHLTSALKERLASTSTEAAPRPHIIVLVDDVDLVAGHGGNPLVSLVPLLAHAAEIGLSLVLTRRVSGAARSAFDPVMQRMKDLGAAGLVMDGTKDEGRLVGDLVAKPLPPGRAQFFTRDSGATLWQLADA